MLRRRVLAAVAVMIAAFGLAFFWLFGGGSVFQQKEAPAGRVIVAIVQTRVLGEPLVKLSDNPEKYVVADMNAYKRMLTRRGYTFKDRFGSAYEVERDGERCVAMSTAFTSKLVVMTSPSC